MMKVTPTSMKELYVEWTLEGDTFTLYRSTSPTDDFEPIAENIKQPFQVDPTVNLYDYNIRYYYRVEGFRNGVKVADDGPASLTYNKPNNIANKVIYESRVVLRVMNNPPVHFLLKKRIEEKCPNCWNSITNQPKFANCKVCGGTGKLSGYHPPIKTKISQDMSQYVMTSGEHDADETTLTPIQAWISNTPIVYPEDVMVDHLNQRFKVVSVAPRTVSQFLIRQVLQLAPLKKGHPAYAIPVESE
ncbi:hypothetical protein AAXE64_27590 [Priestia megaterium]|uniref:hypothetical protein n=1 Tax=Priestia megaterium TaxID=1404 RepID=UPI003D0106E9